MVGGMPGEGIGMVTWGIVMEGVELWEMEDKGMEVITKVMISEEVEGVEEMSDCENDKGDCEYITWVVMEGNSKVDEKWVRWKKE